MSVNRNTTVLVTGGAGFIGSHVVERLLSEGRQVLCLDNFDSFYNPQIKERTVAVLSGNEAFQFVQGDVRDRLLLRNLFEEHTFDAVIHLAARAGVRPSIRDPQLYNDVNVNGTIALLEVCKEYPLRQFLLASSSSVYGITNQVPFREDDAVAMPISPYAASKRAAELYCYTYHHLYGIPILCLRFFTVYGPRQRPDMAIHNFTRLIDSGEGVTIFGDGTSRRDYTYISDIVDGVVAALDYPCGFEIVNLGNSDMVELCYLIQLIEKALGKPAIVRKVQTMPGDVPLTCADITKAKRLLGYQPKVSIEAGIHQFVDWYRRQNQS